MLMTDQKRTDREKTALVHRCPRCRRPPGDWCISLGRFGGEKPARYLHRERLALAAR